MSENYTCHICGGSFMAGLGSKGHFHWKYVEPYEHDFVLEIEGVTSDTRKKWRCRKCLEIKYTND